MARRWRKRAGGETLQRELAFHIREAAVGLFEGGAKKRRS